MRVLYFSSFFEGKGHETYHSNEIKFVIKNYSDTEYIIYTINSDYNRVSRYKDKAIWVERRNLRELKTQILFVKDMVKIFSKFKPDIIHGVYVIESIITGLLGKIFRVPTILHGRGTDINYFPFISIKKNILARIGCFLNKKILTVSKDMKQNIIKLNISEKKITHIYNGVDFTLFKRKKNKIIEKIKKFEIFHIGRFSDEKRHDLILEAMNILKQNNVNFHLTLIGYGHKVLRKNPMAKKIEIYIKNFIKQNNLETYISLKGFIDHKILPDLMESADIYIHPSDTEGMPNSVLEAMSMELPVVLTKAGGMRELYVKDGVIMIEKNSAEKLYNGIKRFIEYPELIINGGKKNREFIIKNFSWDKHAEKLYKIYSDLAKN